MQGGCLQHYLKLKAEGELKEDPRQEAGLAAGGCPPKCLTREAG